jgi:crotonobetainyl-CoA:carnitine CoA-transferase CaiB-like acyl-CoA transferase
MVGEYIVAESIGKPLPVRIGNRDPEFVPHGVYRALDDSGRHQLDLAGSPAIQYHERWVAIAVDSDAAWQALCAVLGDARLERPEWRTAAGRREDEPEIDAVLSEWASAREADECANLLQAAGVAASAVMSPMLLLDDEQPRERSFYQEVAQTEVGRHLTTRPVWRLADRPPGEMRGAPCFGEHNVEVLRDWGGLSDEEISWLAENGVIADVPG